MIVLLLTILVFATAMALMGIGVILKGRSIRRSCGSRMNIGPDGNPQACDSCQCDRREAGPDHPPSHAD